MSFYCCCFCCCCCCCYWVFLADTLIVGDVESNGANQNLPLRKPDPQNNYKASERHVRPSGEPRQTNSHPIVKETSKTEVNSHLGPEKPVKQIENYSSPGPAQHLHHASSIREGTRLSTEHLKRPQTMAGARLEPYSGRQALRPHQVLNTGSSIKEHRPVMFAIDPLTNYFTKQDDVETSHPPGRPRKAGQTSVQDNQSGGGGKHRENVFYQVNPLETSRAGEQYQAQMPVRYQGSDSTEHIEPVDSKATVVLRNASSQGQSHEGSGSSGYIEEQRTPQNASASRKPAVQGSSTHLKDQEQEGSTADAMPSNGTNTEQVKEADGSTPEDDFEQQEATTSESSGEPEEAQEMADQQQGDQQTPDAQQADPITSNNFEQVGDPDEQDYKELHDITELANREDQRIAGETTAPYQAMPGSSTQMSLSNQAVPVRQALSEAPVSPDTIKGPLGEKQAALNPAKGTKPENQDANRNTEHDTTNDESTNCLCPSKGVLIR